MAPAAINWDVGLPVIAEPDVVRSRMWLSQRPYQHEGFLGWEQAWKYMLGVVLFLFSETCRMVSFKSFVNGARFLVFVHF